MKTFYLVTVISKDGRSIERKFVTDTLFFLEGKYSMFTVESIEFETSE